MNPRGLSDSIGGVGVDRRGFLKLGMASALAMTSSVDAGESRFQQAVHVLEQAVTAGTVRAASMVVREHGKTQWVVLGEGVQRNSSFLLGSITKPMAITPLVCLWNEKALNLDDPAWKYLPEFRGDGRDSITIQHLLTHVSGLPDQLPNNAELRRSHAPLKKFVEHALRLKPRFQPGTEYEYSSMAILLACEIAQRITGKSIAELTQQYVFDVAGMKHSALGMGKLDPKEIVDVQTERAAPEAGGGDPSARTWDWNSPYWRALGAPWGGAHASADDVLRFLDLFNLDVGSKLPRPVVERMIRNHNANGLPPRGLGLGLGPRSILSGVSDRAYGHTGSTGTIAWCDPLHDLACVILTSLPGQAITPHPRELAARAFLG